MSLQLDPSITLFVKFAAGLGAVIIIWFSLPPTFGGGLIRKFIPSRQAATKVDDKTVDQCWRTLVTASINLGDGDGVDLLNQWISAYTTSQLEGNQ